MYMAIRMMFGNAWLTSIGMTIRVFKPLIFPIGVTQT